MNHYDWGWRTGWYVRHIATRWSEFLFAQFVSCHCSSGSLQNPFEIWEPKQHTGTQNGPSAKCIKNGIAKRLCKRMREREGETNHITIFRTRAPNKRQSMLLHLRSMSAHILFMKSYCFDFFSLTLDLSSSLSPVQTRVCVCHIIGN